MTYPKLAVQLSNASFIAEGGGPPEVASQHYVWEDIPICISTSMHNSGLNRHPSDGTFNFLLLRATALAHACKTMSTIPAIARWGRNASWKGTPMLARHWPRINLGWERNVSMQTTVLLRTQLPAIRSKRSKRHPKYHPCPPSRMSCRRVGIFKYFCWLSQLTRLVAITSYLDTTNSKRA